MPTSPPPSAERAAPSRSERERRGSSAWSLLAWAGVGFAAARARRAVADRRAEPEAPARGMPAEPVATPDEAPPAEVPDDLDIAWVPGPGVGLRVAQRHLDADLPVVYVHGLGGGLEQWAPCLAAAGERIRPIAFDLPGHGGSDRLDEPSMDRLAACLGAVVDSVGARRVALVAHSLGASIALRWAARHTKRVAGLLLVDPSGDQTKLPARARAAVLDAIAEDPHDELGGHYRQFLRGSAPEIADAVLDQLTATDPAVLHALLAASFAESPAADLSRLRKAGVTVRAVLSPFNDAPISLHHLVPELEIAWVEGAGHWLMLDAPEIFSELQGRFFDACARGRR